ncbi:hypothetical protein CL1_1154 [Thermococcus cleftensis]|uniref:Uncharacterized protein n=1 Tax=Thermococcus cleftensis (strain DSM 27260 / KACC 17922 / CL1) TaxID=163003 RepID=I3ZUH3_THECF|nr:hypothetical protein [Thermococcus cleftensis]AFL95357.1 hypothetical protein CL1_1154 [Thermococcus cleftensis]
MRRANKKRLIPLALALALAMVGAALAVPYITVTVQGIGAGSNVIDNPILSTDVTWSLNAGDPDILDDIVINVTSTRDLSVENGNIIVKFYDDNDVLVYTKVVPVNSLTWTQDTNTGNYWAVIPLGTSITLDDGTGTLTITFGTTTLEQIFTSSHVWINKIAVVYQGP